MARKQAKKTQESEETKTVPETKETKQTPVSQPETKARKPAKAKATTSDSSTTAETKPAKAPRVRKPKDTEPTTEDSSEPTQTRRPPPTRELVESEFDELITRIDAEIEKLRESSAKAKGVRLLRSINKSVKSLKTRALRITKQKSGQKRNNTNSGFLKPVPISPDLASFTGWNPSELHSRVDVTKYICNYVRENNLQNPEDRRQIMVETDPKLKALLRFDGKDNKPLTYYSLQTYLKRHFEGGSKPATKETSEPVKKSVRGKTRV